MHFIRFISLFLVFSCAANAAHVSQIRGKEALIKNDDELEFSLGDKVFVISETGKKIGLLEITGIKDDKVVGTLLKGRFELGATIDQSYSDIRTSIQERAQYSGKINYGLLLGQNSQAMAIQARDSSGQTENLTLKGSNMAYKFFVDYNYSNNINIRSAVGVNPMNLSGSPSNGAESFCSNTASCDANFGYYSIESHVLYNFINMPTRFWGSIGYAYLFASQASTNVGALDTSIKSNWNIPIQIGTDIPFGNIFFPVFFQYAWFNSGSDIVTSSTGIFVGVGL